MKFCTNVFLLKILLSRRVFEKMAFEVGAQIAGCYLVNLSYIFAFILQTRHLTGFLFMN